MTQSVTLKSMMKPRKYVNKFAPSLLLTLPVPCISEINIKI